MGRCIARACIPALAALLVGGGCTGHLYSSHTRPFTTNFNATQVGSKRIVIDRHKFEEPVTGYNINVSWTWGEMARLASEAGITRIDFADEQVLSFFFGTYERRRIIVYGE